MPEQAKSKFIPPHFVPNFCGDWTLQMRGYVATIRIQMIHTNGDTPEVADEFERWLVSVARLLCYSWNCKDKPYIVNDLLERYIKNPEYLATVKEIVNDFSGK